MYLIWTHKFVLKCCGCVISRVLFSVEVLTFYFATFSWHSIDCTLRNKCVKVLLVADPQILGFHNERNSLLTPLTIWDSDRYLSRTFSYAFSFTKPDVIIFLGDLFDEGSTASDEEFKSYFKRLHLIFSKETHFAQRFWLPGDNDIGGEGVDPLTKHKFERFHSYFKQNTDLELNNVKFININRFLGTIPRITNDNSNIGTVIGLSHLPLVTKPSKFIEIVLERLKPQILFTAHEHTAMVSSVNKDYYLGSAIVMSSIKTNEILNYKLGLDKIYELQVPTCSYRMGTPNIGYGYAVIEDNNLQYTVLWTPSRLLQLKFYAIFIASGCIFIYFSYCCIRHKNTYSVPNLKAPRGNNIFVRSCTKVNRFS